MTRSLGPSKVESLALPAAIAGEVEGWRRQGYSPFPSETTRLLLQYWFGDQGEFELGFHECQRRAIETIIYCHEKRGIKNLRQLYEDFAPERLKLFKTIADEADGTPFLKYCLKMATGSGKTWVLGALIVWQYFNAINGETERTGTPFSSRFLVVTPGVEVLNRMLDSFRGKRDPLTGQRDPATSDYRRPLFMPETAEWRGRFDLTVLQPADLRANASPPDGPFVAVVNWQQFVTPKDKPSLAEQLGLASPDEARGEIIADFMTEYPDLIVLNDEAHHVHGKKTAKNEELVWRRFMDVLDDRMRERHGAAGRKLFAQIDFSATPFYGSGHKREYFPHIVYDYDLRDALRDMLVKQVFLEERQTQPGTPALGELDFRAERGVADRGRIGEVVGLSSGQRQIIDIGVSKLNQLTEDFTNKGLNRKPVLMVLCEDTTVADLVHDHLLTVEDFQGRRFTRDNLLAFHSELTVERHGYTMEEARGAKRVNDPGRSVPTLDKIDDDNDPLRIVISVLALREGFDKSNICVIAVLRATEADLLLEQIVGRGLRLMFPKYKYPEATIQDAKLQAFEALRNHEQPNNSLDFLYIVEHPRFRTFYDDLRKEGYLIAAGDSTRTKAAGDLAPVDAEPQRIPLRDIAWPLAVHEEASLPDLAAIPVRDLPACTLRLDDVKTVMANVSITDRDIRTDTRAKTWELRDKYFDYGHYLSATAIAIAKQGKTHVLTSRLAEIAALVDEYTTHRLFARTVNFAEEENYRVLAYRPLQDHVINTLRNVIAELLGQIRYQVQAVWQRVSDLPRVFVRGESYVETRRCVYPRMPVAARFGGLEREVMSRLLDKSQEVLGWCKLQKKHNLAISYRDPSGLMRSYEVDFVVRTARSCYLLETKSDDELTHPTVGTKARAAKTWCESVSGVAPPAHLIPDQPGHWEYLMLSESVYYANQGSGFESLVPLMRLTRDQVIAQQFHGSLFV